MSMLDPECGCTSYMCPVGHGKDGCAVPPTVVLRPVRDDVCDLPFHCCHGCADFAIEEGRFEPWNARP